MAARGPIFRAHDTHMPERMIHGDDRVHSGRRRRPRAPTDARDDMPKSRPIGDAGGCRASWHIWRDSNFAPRAKEWRAPGGPCPRCALTHEQKSIVEVAGWTISARYAAEVPEVGSQLERYARHLNAVEINSSFNKSHRVETYIRWSAATPIGFRFAVKAPRTITHEHRFVDCAALLDTFAAQVHGLGPKLGLILIQLSTSLVFELGSRSPSSPAFGCDFLYPSQLSRDIPAGSRQRSRTGSVSIAYRACRRSADRARGRRARRLERGALLSLARLAENLFLEVRPGFAHYDADAT